MIPTTKLIADLHRQVIAHAGRTKKEAVSKPGQPFFNISNIAGFI